MCGQPEASILMQVKYRLTAQLESFDEEQWEAKLPDLGIAKLRHEADLYINCNEARLAEPNRNIVKALNSKSGGFLGIGQSESVSAVELEKDVYTVGEAIKVKILSDHYESKKEIKKFKYTVKLLKNVQATCVFKNKVKPCPTFTNHQRYI